MRISATTRVRRCESLKLSSLTSDFAGAQLLNYLAFHGGFALPSGGCAMVEVDDEPSASLSSKSGNKKCFQSPPLTSNLMQAVTFEYRSMRVFILSEGGGRGALCLNRCCDAWLMAPPM